ncbi:MAG TPA: AAA family ATPase [Candidatus Baltobacteraceae bacterium]|jgi:5-methylcytosine-specific restriction protein B|nr:AAA family ATPase [Candidatus Baltobacteraceae bacterium]
MDVVETSAGFDIALARLRAANSNVEDETFKWDDVREILWLQLTNTDVVASRKTTDRSHATSIEITDGANTSPNKVRDFFPALAFSERYPERRTAVPIRWRRENVTGLTERFGQPKSEEPGWDLGTCQIRRTRNRNETQNPGLMIAYENDMHDLRAALQEHDALVFVRRGGVLSYEVFGIAPEPPFDPILNGKRIFVRDPSPGDRRQVWTYKDARLRSLVSFLEQPAGPQAQSQIDRVVAIAKEHGSTAIIALAGVPGTGKTYVSERAAIAIAGDRSRVEVVQFHAAYAYEEFVEGITFEGEPKSGLLLRLNEKAAQDLSNTYVLVIEELTRADLSAVLGELLTYIEYRDRFVTLPYSGKKFRLAPNVIVLATYNPTDRSALEVDAALLRRLRIIDFLPSYDLAFEILKFNGVDDETATKAASVMLVQKADPRWAFRMPFGHGIYADVRGVNDLQDLWEQRISRFLHGPWEDHPYAADITAAYPWRKNA